MDYLIEMIQKSSFVHWVRLLYYWIFTIIPISIKLHINANLYILQSEPVINRNRGKKDCLPFLNVM